MQLLFQDGDSALTGPCAGLLLVVIMGGLYLLKTGRLGGKDVGIFLTIGFSF